MIESTTATTPRLIGPKYLIFIFTCIGMLILWPAQQALIAEGRDIRQDYLGVKRLLTNQNLYTDFSNAEYEEIKVDPGLGMPKNFHPPTTLVFFLPFALFPFPIAVALWSFFSLLCFYAGVYLIAQELKQPVLLWLSGLACFWFPLWLHIRFGQFSTLIFLLVTLMWLSFRRGQDSRAGWFAGLAALVKIFPLLFGGLLFLRGKWKALFVFVATFLVVAVGLYLWQPEGSLQFITDIAGQNSDLFKSYFGNFSLNGFLGRLLVGERVIPPMISAPALHKVFFWLLSGVTLLTLLAYNWLSQDDDLIFSLYIVAMLMLSPTTWAHNWVMLLLPIAILFERYRQNWTKPKTMALVVLLLLSSFPHWQFYEYVKANADTLPLPAWFQFTSPGFYLLALLWFLLLQQATQSMRSVRPGDTADNLR